ncbi:MAG: hypothetical protein P4K83_02210 [Terracidiphilus sp.]|nr:hypothetical protein [Terracidiphilus sp.]
MSQPTRIEQLGSLMTAMIAVIVSGNSGLLPQKKENLVADIDPHELRNGGRYYGIFGCVAKKLGVTRSYVNAAAHGHRCSPRVRQALLDEIKRIDSIQTVAPLTPSERKQLTGQRKYRPLSPCVAAALGVANSTVRRVINGERNRPDVLAAIRAEMERINSLTPPACAPLSRHELALLRRGKYYGTYVKVARDLRCGVDKVAYQAKNPTGSQKIRQAVRAEIARIEALGDIQLLTDSEKRQFRGGGRYRGTLAKVARDLGIPSGTVVGVACGRNSNYKVLAAIRAEMARIDMQTVPLPISREEREQCKRGGRYAGIYGRVAKSLGVSRVLPPNVASGKLQSRRVLEALRDEMARIDAEIAAKNGGAK